MTWATICSRFILFSFLILPFLCTLFSSNFSRDIIVAFRNICVLHDDDRLWSRYRAESKTEESEEIFQALDKHLLLFKNRLDNICYFIIVADVCISIITVHIFPLLFLTNSLARATPFNNKNMCDDKKEEKKML